MSHVHPLHDLHETSTQASLLTCHCIHLHDHAEQGVLNANCLRDWLIM